MGVARALSKRLILTVSARVRTFDTVKAGLHCSFRMSKHMLPLELMLGWYTFVAKLTCHQVYMCSS